MVPSMSYWMKQRVLNSLMMSVSIPTEAERTAIPPPREIAELFTNTKLDPLKS